MTQARAFGVPRGMPRRIRIAALAIAASLLSAATAAAADFCTGLRQAIVYAERDFTALAIAGERGRAGTAPARTLLPGASRCELRATRGALEYRCRMTRIDALPAEARAEYRRDVGRMRGCFAGMLPRGDGDYSGRTEWTGAVIWQPRSHIRAAAIFFVAESLAFVADDGEDDAIADQTASWIVVEKRR